MANILYWRTNCEAQLRAAVRVKQIAIDHECCSDHISEVFGLLDGTDHDCIITTDYTQLGESLADVLTMMSLFRHENMNVDVLFLDTGITLLSEQGRLVEQTLMTWCSYVVQQERQRRAASRRAYPLRSRGRPSVKATPEQVLEARKTLSISQAARRLGIGVSSVKRLQKIANEQSIH